MANVKISQLPSLSTLSGADEFPVVNGATTYNVTANAIAAFATISVPVANVSGIGNIATVNLNANASTVLAGDGTWVAQSGSANTGDVTFETITVQGVNGLNLSAGPDFTANLAYLQVRAGDQPSHIHLDTGNNSAYDLLVGDDSKYVQIGLGGNISIASYDSTGPAQYIWNYGIDGNLTLPSNTSSINYANGAPYGGGGASTGDITFVNTTISAPAAEPISIQALDNDSLVGSQLLLDPDNTLTRLDGFSGQDSNSWTTADWATGVYTTQGGGTIGAVEFTGATTIIDYINSLSNPEYVFIQVNGGPLLPFAGSSSGSTNITFYTNDLPATDPTTVTDFAYYFSVNSFIEMDYDSQELNIEGNGLDVTISTRDNSDIEINSIRNLNVNGNGSYSIRNFSSNDPIQIQTDSNGGAQTWSFGANGILSLPGEGVLQSTDDQVTLRSFDSGSGEANLVYLGTSGGLGFQDTSAGGNWLEIFRSGTNPQIGTPGNLLITADSTNTAPTWTYDNTGTLKLATVANESAAFVGARKVIGGLNLSSPYSVTMNAGGTPTVAYTALAGTQSVKVTFVIESSGSGFQWEQFDVVAVPSQDVGGAVNYVVSNRVKGNSTIPDTVVTATMNGLQIEISLTLDATQTSGGTASFDAVEFGLMVD